MKTKPWIFLFLVILIALVVTVAASAQNIFAIDWWSINSGGGTSQAGSYGLSGSIGQYDAGPALSGGVYSINGGYWTGEGSALIRINVPLIFKGH